MNCILSSESERVRERERESEREKERSYIHIANIKGKFQCFFKPRTLFSEVLCLFIYLFFLQLFVIVFGFGLVLLQNTVLF